MNGTDITAPPIATSDESPPIAVPTANMPAAPGGWRELESGRARGAPAPGDLRAQAAVVLDGIGPADLGPEMDQALDAFVRDDAETALRICRRDDEVDRLNRQLFSELISTMIQNPSTIPRALELILVARNLERVGDMATNVAEEVVFIAEARVIKHHAEDRGEPRASGQHPSPTPV